MPGFLEDCEDLVEHNRIVVYFQRSKFERGMRTRLDFKLSRVVLSEY